MSKPVDELPCVRYDKIDNEGQSCYIVISGHNGEPVEIFFSFVDENNVDKKNKFSSVTCMTRFISKFLSYGGPVSETIHQLERSSRSPNDIADLIKQCMIDFRSSSQDLSKNGLQKWKIFDSDRTCVLEEGVYAGDQWYKVKT